MITKQQMLAAMKDIRDNGPGRHNTGICGNLIFLLNHNPLPASTDPVSVFIHDQLYLLFVTWPEYSGSLAFPVEASRSSGLGPISMWLRVDNKWIGEYGAARSRLLSHCITELEKELGTNTTFGNVTIK